jgi:hypothetical protein
MYLFRVADGACAAIAMHDLPATTAPDFSAVRSSGGVPTAADNMLLQTPRSTECAHAVEALNNRTANATKLGLHGTDGH